MPCSRTSTSVEVIHCFTAAVMALMLEKSCPCRPPFIGLNKWKSEGAKPRLYVRGSRKGQLRLVMCFMVFRRMRPGVIMLKKKLCLLQPDSGSVSLQLRQGHNIKVRVERLSRFHKIQKDHPFPTPKLYTALSSQGYILNLDGKFICNHSTDCSFDTNS